MPGTAIMFTMKYYKLVDKKPVQCTAKDFDYWELINERRIAFTNIVGINGNIDISTIFLGLDHQFGSGEPILFETCIFGGDRDQEITRYHTYDQAVEGHKNIVNSLSKKSKNISKKPNDKRNCRRIHLRT